MNAIQKRREARGESGFTLIELLVVIAILGILAAVVVFAVGNTTDNAKVKSCRLEKRALQTGLEGWKGNGGVDERGGASDVNGYPDEAFAGTADSVYDGNNDGNVLGLELLSADEVDLDGAGAGPAVENKSRFVQDTIDPDSWDYNSAGGASSGLTAAQGGNASIALPGQIIQPVIGKYTADVVADCDDDPNTTPQT